MMGDVHELTTPKGRVFRVNMWGILPYITKDELHQVIHDLPHESVAGRSGQASQEPTVSRCSRNVVGQSQIREQLKHLNDDMSKKDVSNVSSKYKNMPDAYYGGVSNDFVTPQNLDEYLDSTERARRLGDEDNVRVWELYSGTSAFSNHLKEKKDRHLPPIDYRYGWNLSKYGDQMQVLKTQLEVGVDTLFASPNCSPWGNNSRSTPVPLRQERRNKEWSTLRFLAVACFFQILLNRKYIIESCAFSDIFDDSPLGLLREHMFHLAMLDQCACGGELEGQPIRKRSHFQSSHVLHHLHKVCSGGA